MLLSALAFLAGTCLLLLCPLLPDPVWLAVLVVATVPVIRLHFLRHTMLVILGCCWASWQAGNLLNKTLPADLQGRDILVQGLIDSLPERITADQIRFRFSITRYRTPEGWQPLSLPVRLTWYRDALPLKAGEEWRLLVRLKKPHGFSNPGGFDYERWLFSHAIRATGYIKKSTANQRIQDSSDQYIARFRQHVSETLVALDLPATTIAVLRALTVGDRTGMTQSQWQLLQSTGTSHLLAISGLHVGLVAALVFAFSRRVWAWSGAAHCWPAPRFAALAAMLAALGYALLAGFQVPAQRALIMTWVWMLAIITTGRANAWQTLGIALWVIVLLDPLAALRAGFWLSFAAVAVIFHLSSGRHGSSGLLKRVLTLQTGLVAGLMPLTWFWFQQASWVALPANLIAIPWVGTLIVPLLLLSVVLLPWFADLSNALLYLAAWLLEWLWVWLSWLSKTPEALLAAPAGPSGWLLLCAIGLLILLLPRAYRTGLLAAFLIAPVFMLKPDRPADGNLWVTLLDVGQGLSVVLETSHHTLVYDTGPAFRSGFNTGSGVVAPFLRSRGYRAIDRLIISHGDNDHRGGAEPLLQQLRTKSLHSGDPAAVPGRHAAQCRSGQHWRWDNVDFEYLAPLRPATGNNGSCVLKITAAGGRSILLTGDIERAVEKALLEVPGVNLSADVLVAPHHGSLTSSTPPFVARVHPELVLFPVGHRNRFGFPKEAVTERYNRIGAKLMNTAEHGAISVKFKAGEPLETHSWRMTGRRLWHSPEHR